MIVYEVEDADAMKKREALMIRAKVPSPFLVCSANLETNLDENPANIKTQFSLSVFSLFYSKDIDSSFQQSLSQRLVLSLESAEAFVRGS